MTRNPSHTAIHGLESMCVLVLCSWPPFSPFLVFPFPGRGEKRPISGERLVLRGFGRSVFWFCGRRSLGRSAVSVVGSLRSCGRSVVLVVRSSVSFGRSVVGSFARWFGSFVSFLRSVRWFGSCAVGLLCVVVDKDHFSQD